MKHSKRKNRHRMPPALWISICASFALGIWLLAASSGQPVNGITDIGLLIKSLRHDLGIALCVSSVIGFLFELYRSKWLEIENMRDVIDYVMGDKLTPEVWADVIDQIEGKCVILQKVELRLELQIVPYLPGHEAVLSVEHKYELSSLRDRRSKYEVRHELDYQFNLQDPKLPKWEQAEVDPANAAVAEKEIVLDGAAVTFKVSLPPRSHSESVVIRTRRAEIVPLPGSYNFYVPEFMRGFHLQLVKCPPGFRAETVIRPHGGAKPISPIANNSWTYEGLIFPGQGIEVKFIEDTNSGVGRVGVIDSHESISEEAGMEITERTLDGVVALISPSA